MPPSRIDILRSYIKEDPADTFSIFALALELINQRNDTEALLLMEQLFRNHPDYLANYYHYGKLLERIGQMEKAINVYLRGEHVATLQKNQKTFNEIRSAREELTE